MQDNERMDMQVMVTMTKRQVDLVERVAFTHGQGRNRSAGVRLILADYERRHQEPGLTETVQERQDEA